MTLLQVADTMACDIWSCWLHPQTPFSSKEQIIWLLIHITIKYGIVKTMYKGFNSRSAHLSPPLPFWKDKVLWLSNSSLLWFPAFSILGQLHSHKNTLSTFHSKKTSEQQHKHEQQLVLMYSHTQWQNTNQPVSRISSNVPFLSQTHMDKKNMFPIQLLTESQPGSAIMPAWNNCFTCICQDLNAAIIWAIGVGPVTHWMGPTTCRPWKSTGLWQGRGTSSGWTWRGWGRRQEAKNFLHCYRQLLVLLHLQADPLRLLQHLFHGDGEADVIDVLHGQKEYLGIRRRCSPKNQTKNNTHTHTHKTNKNHYLKYQLPNLYTNTTDNLFAFIWLMFHICIHAKASLILVSFVFVCFSQDKMECQIVTSTCDVNESVRRLHVYIKSSHRI